MATILRTVEDISRQCENLVMKMLGGEGELRLVEHSPAKLRKEMYLPDSKKTQSVVFQYKGLDGKAIKPYLREYLCRFLELDLHNWMVIRTNGSYSLPYFQDDGGIKVSLQYGSKGVALPSIGRRVPN